MHILKTSLMKINESKYYRLLVAISYLLIYLYVIIFLINIACETIPKIIKN